MRAVIGKSGSILVGIVYAAILTLLFGGGFRTIDDGIEDLRFAATQRVATGSVVFVDIDSASLNTVGVWPWPRHVHADLLNALMALDASDVTFDVDFSMPSTESEDAAFAAALDKAGGYAYLAAFRQQRNTAGATVFNLPIERFRQFADPVVVNVSLNPAGMVRSYPFALTIGDRKVLSLAALLAGINDAPAGAAFNIDYSIEPATIDRISAADLLAGKVDPGRVAGKQVIIGASAVELRDLFVVPRYGALPGALLQALAAETLKQGRPLQPAGPWQEAAVVLMVGLVALLGRRRIPLPLAIAAALVLSAGAEAVALWLQVGEAVLVDTAAIHAATIALVGAVFVAELVRRGEQRLSAMRERDAVRRILDRVITDNFDGVVIANAEGRIVSASQFAETILGRNLHGEHIAAALPPSFAGLLTGALASHGQQGELALPVGDSERILEYVVTHSQVQFDHRPSPVACLTFRDITERRRAEDRLRYLGGHDPLTGALSRTRLTELIVEALAAHRDVAVVIADLRRFRIINDTLGHNQGDLLLKQVVSRLMSMGPDAVARLGGDSFALLVPAMPPEKLKGYCETVAQWISFPYQLARGHQAIIAASAGATTSTVSGRDSEVLLSHADMALSAAKQHSGNGVALFTPEMDRRLKDRQAMDAALRQALARREFRLAYQPQVDLVTGDLLGAEALARWTHATLGPIAPSDFVAAAEETGLIVELGRWALTAACTEAATWPRGIKVSVNVSPVQFELSDVVADVTAALEVSGLDPARLELEITEGVFVRDAETMTSRLEALRRLGVSVALDDFGTGYSSLSYLGQLPIDKIKIDQSFVKRLPADTEAAAVIRAVVALSETLGKQIIAEGIETADQAWMLQMIGCTQAQGFYFGRPMTAAEFAERLCAPPVRLAESA